MYFPFFKLKKWGKKTAEARRHNCAVLPKESKPSCVCTAGFAGRICCFPLTGKFVHP